MDWSDLSTPWDPVVSDTTKQDMKKLRNAVEDIVAIAKREQLEHIPDITRQDDETHGSHGINDLPIC